MTAAVVCGAGRAVVLGGGGVTGISWEAGVAHGLWEHGLDLRAADLFVGTSAGSVVAAHLAAGTDPGELYARQFRPAPREVSPEVDVEVLLAALADATTGPGAPARARARIGTMAEGTSARDAAARRAAIVDRLPDGNWPHRLRATAVDVATGEIVIFDGRDGTAMADAVLASCAVPGVWPTVPIGHRRLMDGGSASVAHATVAQGHPVVVVVAAMSPAPTTATSALDDEVAQLRAAGSRVVVIGPDTDYLRGPGADPLSPVGRGDAARAGHRFGAAVADQLGQVWSTTEVSDDTSR